MQFLTTLVLFVAAASATPAAARCKSGCAHCPTDGSGKDWCIAEDTKCGGLGIFCVAGSKCYIEGQPSGIPDKDTGYCVPEAFIIPK